MEPLLIITEIIDEGSFLDRGVIVLKTKSDPMPDIILGEPQSIVLHCTISAQSYGNFSKYVTFEKGVPTLNKRKLAVDILAGTLPIKGKKL